MLEAKDLTASYADYTALQGVSCLIEEGSTVALVGPNGAGKSTFLRLAAGLLEPSSGHVTIDGHPAGSLEARALVSYLPDTPALYDDLSLNEHLEYVARMHGVDAWEDRAAELLERLGLEETARRVPGDLSGGQQQRVAIARALVNRPSVLLADEPTGNLDTAAAREVVAVLKERHADGQTIVLVTHDMRVASAAERVIAMRDGRVVGEALPSARGADEVLSRVVSLEA
jgi:heme ABC exporter ATP-binding subunit CcmA